MLAAILRFLSVCVVIGGYVTLLYLYLRISYLGLLSGKYQTNLMTNAYHEHWIEFLALLLGIPGIYFIVKDLLA